MTTIRRSLRLRLWAALSATFLLAPMAHAACPEILALVDAGLPADVGDVDRMRALLQPPKPAAPASSAFDAKKLAKAVGAKGFSPDGSECCTDAKCVYRNDDDEVIRLKAAKGSASFLSHLRSSELDENTISEEQAIAMTRTAMRAMGLTDDEVDEATVRAAAVEETMADVPGRVATPSVSRRAEVLVRIRRQIGDVPVEGSGAGAAIAPSGQIARLRLRWPAFELVDGLDAADTLPRAEILEQVAEALTELNPCTSLTAVRSEIRYIPMGLVDGVGDADAADHSEEEPHPVTRFAYLPALKVTALPIEQAEDSGVPQEAGLVLYMPLLRSGE